MEHAIAETKRRILHARIKRLDRTGFIDFGTLRGHREAFEEAKAAYAALERAIERGYVDIDAAG